MSILKKRSTAICIFVLVVVLFSFIGCHRSLDKACRQAEEAFFDASLLHDEGYYTCPGDQLGYCVGYANRLLSVLGNDNEAYRAEYDQLRQARLDLMDALEGRDIPAIGQAAQTFAQAVDAVEARHDAGAPLADSHDDYDAILDGIHGALAELDSSAYSSHILSFREEVLDAFPTNILRHITFVRAPETFP